MSDFSNLSTYAPSYLHTRPESPAEKTASTIYNNSFFSFGDLGYDFSDRFVRPVNDFLGNMSNLFSSFASNGRKSSYNYTSSSDVYSSSRQRGSSSRLRSPSYSLSDQPSQDLYTPSSPNSYNPPPNAANSHLVDYFAETERKNNNRQVRAEALERREQEARDEEINNLSSLILQESSKQSSSSQNKKSQDRISGFLADKAKEYGIDVTQVLNLKELLAELLARGAKAPDLASYITNQGFDFAGMQDSSYSNGVGSGFSDALVRGLRNRTSSSARAHIHNLIKLRVVDPNSTLF